MKKSVVVLLSVFMMALLFVSCECKHNIEEVPAVEPTCEDKGYTKGTRCTKCGKFIDEPKEIAAIGHSFKTVSTTSTCTKAGVTTYKCSVCSKTEEKETKALGHNYEREVIVAPTCYSEGNAVYTCSVCNDKYEKLMGVVDHEYTEATCSAPATCKYCGITTGETKEHAYGSNGICTVCGQDSYETVSVNGIKFRIQRGPLTVKDNYFGGNKCKISNIRIEFEHTYDSYARFYVYYDLEKIGGNKNHITLINYSLIDEDGFIVSQSSDDSRNDMNPGDKSKDESFGFNLNHVSGDLKRGVIYTLTFTN